MLLVEDDRASRDAMRRFLERKGFSVLAAEEGRAALRALTPAVDLVLSDLRMEGMDGMELLVEAKLFYPDKPFLLISAYGDIKQAVDAMRLGAEDFLTKPVDPDELLHKIGRLVERRIDSAERPADAPAFRAIVGRSAAWYAALAKVAAVARSNCTALITGESGTGKELVAAAIHAHGARRDGPFVAFSAAEIPETLVESELFGHRRGAFTGAERDRPGRLAAADGGTLLIDEIGEMSPATQAKILRALESREITPLGDVKPRRFDARIIFATNRDLPAEVAAGRFREDLYYRINVAHLHLPPLRDRRDDIPLLVRHFAAEFARRHGRDRIGVSERAMERLAAHDWPGNARELRNVIESAVVMLTGDSITVADLADRVRGCDAAAPARDAPSVGTTVAEAELDLVVRTLRLCGGNRTRAAVKLGLSIRTLQRMIKDRGIAL